MPIKPENKHFYKGKHWKHIRAWTMERAKNRCQFCGVKNYAIVDSDRVVVAEGPEWTFQQALRWKQSAIAKWDRTDMIVIVLTCAHLDHNPENNHPDNLRALCQKCHLAWDAKLHAENSKKTRQRKAEQGMTLFNSKGGDDGR